MIIRFCTLLAFLSVSLLASGQYFSDGGRFSVAEKTACAPYGNPIVINAPECDGVTTACSIDFDQGDGVPNTLALVDGQAFSHVYTQPGSYIIRIQFGTTGGFDQIEMTILPDEAPDFDIYTCSGNRVQVEIADNGYADYTIDYESDGTIDNTTPPGMVSPFHTYPVSTAQTITVRPDYVNCSPTSKTVTPVPGPFSPPAPLINTLQVLNDNTIQLDLTTAQNFYYQLDMSVNSAAAWMNQQKVTDQTTLSIPSLTPDQNYYCFRLGTVDICNGASPTYTGSNVICSADLDLSVADDLIRLDWNTSAAGVSGFSIVKTPGGTISVGPSPFSYGDTDLICGTQYGYQVIHEYGAGIRSFSKTLTGTAISNRVPSPVNNVTTVINGDQLDLTWLQEPGFIAQQYEVFRITENRSIPVGSTPDQQYNDAFDPDAPVCYQINYTDICGNRSDPGSVVCPIILEATLGDNNSVLLSWPSYNGWAGGVSEYRIEKYDASGQLQNTLSAGTGLTYTDSEINGDADQVFTYRVLAIAADGTLLPLPSVSNTELIIRNPNLAHPTAFIPGSSIEANKTFRVLGSFIESYELKIFNRWGELIFESVDKETGWDGTFRGQRMPEGTYVFQARIVDHAGRTFEYAGTVVLLKKA